VIGIDPAVKCKVPREIYMENNNTIEPKVPEEEYQKSEIYILEYTLSLGLQEFITTYCNMRQFFTPEIRTR
jgi:hypothetical protein